MIKNLKVSDKVVRKFKSNKSWKYSTINSLGGISLEQTNLDGDRIPLVINEAQSLATEQNANNTKVKIRRGKRIDGTFYPQNHIFYDETKIEHIDWRMIRTKASDHFPILMRFRLR